MRAHRKRQRRKLETAIQWLLVFAMMIAAAPAAWAEAAGSPAGQADGAVFERLKAGQRQQVAAREYASVERPTVYLTFDDGPSVHTPEVLDILQEEQVPATFFVLGQAAEARPDLVKRIVREGHAIGNHTYDHVYDTLYGSFGEFWKQVRQTDSVLEQKADVRTRLLRAPGGTSTNFDASYFYYLETAGYAIFDWNVDSGDSRRRGVPASEIVQGATNVTLRDEMIVLMHDSAGHGETVKALPDIIRFYKEKGYAFAVLTPDVKPVQFALGKLKWKRSVDFADFARWTLAAGERAAGWPDEIARVAAESAAPDRESERRLERQGQLAAEESAKALQAAAPPLELALGASKLSLPGAEYRVESGKLYVPLRKVVESIGGTVRWEERNRQAIVQYGMYRAVYDLAHRSIAVTAPGKAAQTFALADMSLTDSKLMVPLRTAVELLGSEVSLYAMEGDKREVRVLVRDGYGLALAPRAPVEGLFSARMLAHADQP
ncbi:polysaccharide deacetylase [Paenibacillus flagellatus]|uniref:Polysaccharide deacetylase n=1 Tax=Paenibacillus flagellatus TaxID=2211139 RepID=A0A2V5JWR4_9BACL|nr:polysaccharide deacetylase [Paenibacillus flagellatus]PYI50632.1 polysaccharide deacetylase [Paenibacillus flagellatus]